MFFLLFADKDSGKGKCALFQCPIEGCSKLFSCQKAIDSHIILGKCSLEENISTKVTEKAKDIYAKKVTNLFPTMTKSLHLPVKNVEGESKLIMGWAAKEPKLYKAFSDTQKAFMVNKFEIGKTTGCKVDPYQASEEMRKSGKYQKEEFLSGQQIGAFFSRLCQEEKKATPADIKAVKHEETKDGIILEVKEVFRQERKSKKRSQKKS